MAVVEDLKNALDADPGFTGEPAPGIAERAKQLSDFEQEQGVILPTDVRAFSEHGVYELAPRLFTSPGQPFPSILGETARPIAPSRLREITASLHKIISEYCGTPSQLAWVQALVPVLLDNDDTYVMLDYGYDKDNPPLVGLSMETPWVDGRAFYVASSLLEYLRLPSWTEGVMPDIAPIEPSGAAVAWLSWHTEFVVEAS